MPSLKDIAHMNTLTEEERNELEQKEQNSDILSSEDLDEQTNQENEVKVPNPVAKKKKELELDFSDSDYIEVPVMMKADDMFRFMMRHAYYGVSGILGLAISTTAIVLLISGIANDNALSLILLIFAAVMFTVINPLNILLRSKKQAKNMTPDNAPYIYTFGDVGIKVAQLEESVCLTWDTVVKVREGKTSIYLYLAANRAFVLPKESLKNYDEKFRAILTRNVDEKRIKFSKKN